MFVNEWYTANKYINQNVKSPSNKSHLVSYSLKYVGSHIELKAFAHSFSHFYISEEAPQGQYSPLRSTLYKLMKKNADKVFEFVCAGH